MQINTERILQWNKADRMVYDHFNATFWRRLNAYGFDRMKADLSIFRQKINETRDACIDENACRRMKLNVVPYTKMLREKMPQVKPSQDQMKKRMDWCHQMQTMNKSQGSFI